MKTDIQIAQEAVMKPIKEVAASIGNCMENTKPSFLMNCGRQ